MRMVTLRREFEEENSSVLAMQLEAKTEVLPCWRQFPPFTPLLNAWLFRLWHDSSLLPTPLKIFLNGCCLIHRDRVLPTMVPNEPSMPRYQCETFSALTSQCPAPFCKKRIYKRIDFWEVWKKKKVSIFCLRRWEKVEVSPGTNGAQSEIYI